MNLSMRHARCHGHAFIPILIVIALAWPGPASTQQLMADDTVAIVRLVLNEFRTVNGPIIELSPTVPCAFQAEHGVIGAEHCPSSAVSIAMREHAEGNAATLRPWGDPSPNCRWSDTPAAAPKGLRLGTAIVLRDSGEVHVTVSVRCVGYARQPTRAFLESRTYEVRLMQGEWRVARVVRGVIT